MSSVPSSSSVRWSDLTHPVVAGLISVIGLDIGGAFWGLVIGLMAYAVLNGRLPQRAPESAMAPTAANKGAN